MKLEDVPLFKKLADGDLLGLLMYLEGRGEPIEGRIAIANVVRNRVNKSESKSYFVIITAKNQFSCFNSNDKNYDIGLKIATDIFSGKMPEDLTRKFQECRWVAHGIINGSILDNVGGAQFYFNPKIVIPSWADKMTVIKIIGNHEFLKEK